MVLKEAELRPVGVLEPKAELPDISSLDCLVPPVVGDLGIGDKDLLEVVLLNLLVLFWVFWNSAS